MKKTHIIGIVIIAIAIGVIITSISDSSTYASFNEAFKYPGREFHVVGQYNKDKEQVYRPEENPNLFAFYMIDNQGVERKVQLRKSKPQDFERSEQIVLIGKAKGEDFIASDMLMKCPSKYDNGTGELVETEEPEKY